MRDNKLAAVVCGMPFSGTTYLSRIITSHAKIDAGFECGLLFGENPSDFKNAAPKFYEWMISEEHPHNWKLSAEQMREICDVDNFYKGYENIVSKCHLFKGEKSYVLDKTPAYIYNLTNIMRKVPETPFVVIRKNIFLQYHSYKKRNIPLEEFVESYKIYYESLNRALALPLRKRLLVLEFEETMKYQGKTFIKVFKFLNKFNSNISFSTDLFAEMKSKLQKDIDSKNKKLRKKFDFAKELISCKKDISESEIQILEEFITKNNNVKMNLT